VAGAAPFPAPGADRLSLECQCNENAKIPAFCSALPEADHNEIIEAIRRLRQR
jgi:hypothetical protein